MPISQDKKCRRESQGAQELRPSAWFKGDTGSNWRRPSQQHIYQAKMKEELRPAQIETSFACIKQRLDSIVEELLKDPEHWIPSIDFEDIANNCVPLEALAKLRRSGVIRIRRVLPKKLATDMNSSIMEDFRSYFKVDPGRYTQVQVFKNLIPQRFVPGSAGEGDLPQIATRPDLTVQSFTHTDLVRMDTWRTEVSLPGASRPL